jgi:nitrous oxidase accessory protein NosD
LQNARLRLVAFGATSIAAAALVGVPSLSNAAGSALVYVNAAAAGTQDDSSCANASQTTIQGGVDTVSAGGTVIVCAGSYTGFVTISKRLTLHGQRGAVVDATGQPYGIGIGADYVTVSGMTVKNAHADDNTGAPGDGIVTAALTQSGPAPFSHATIVHNRLRNNDGAGVDLESTSGTLVASNVSTGNGIGINIADDLGKASSSNVVTGNISSGNGFCGIVMADHNGLGITGNRVLGNVANGNGADGGAGILMASPVPNAVITGNRVRGNQMNGNGHAGLEVHIHASGADFSGNSVIANTIGKNNLKGDYKDAKTTGMYVGSASPLKLRFARNLVYGDGVGVFTAGKVTLDRWGNAFQHVGVAYKHITGYAG